MGRDDPALAGGHRPGGKRGQGFTYEELITQQYPGSNIDAWFEANGVPPDMQEQWWNYALAKLALVRDHDGQPHADRWFHHLLVPLVVWPCLGSRPHSR